MSYDVTSSSDHTSSSSLGSLDQSLAPRQTAEQHSHLTAELQRLHHLVQSSSKTSTTAEVLAARHKAELEEAGRALDRVNRGQYSTATEHSLREEEQNVRSVVSAVRGEVEQQQAVVDALVERCADRPSTATLTADCTAKKLRQLYYSRQQQQVVSLELEQLARHDLVAILVQCEAEAVRQTLQLLAVASSQLTLQHHAVLLRSAKLRQLGLCVEEDRAMGVLPAPLRVLVAMVEEEEEKSDDGIAKLSSALAGLSGVGAGGEGHLNRRDTTQVGTVCSALEQLWRQLQEAGQTLGSYGHTHALNKLWNKCSLLEECLGGSGGRLPGSLPGSWLPAHLMDAHADMETRAYELKHDMMAFLKQYEHKKKILSGQPELEEQLSSWTRPVADE
ncbi:hypothetical protein FHG87_020055 [Trinorchestia longiramus]|nr:hypothetical protein FHG87_020055 [Trinorchestia longiramus]